MGIEANFDMKAIDKYLSERLDTLDELIIRNLNFLGMKCVSLAKSLDTYKDRTANLRNSIGYVVLKNGRVKYENFKAEKQGAELSEESGVLIGLEFARDLAKRFSEGYVLIVVAGMQYASYVEDIHHLDVLSSAEKLAESEIENVAKKIINSMVNSL